MTSHDELIDALVRNDRSGATQTLARDELVAALDLAARYARIEQQVLGSAKVAYSPTSLQAKSHTEDDALAMGEFIATSERGRLGLPAGPILEPWRLIEEQGIKVLPRRFPPQYSGGFFFDDTLGPCILVQVDGSDSALHYSLAHQYAHWLLDYDPYITTLCGWPSGMSVEDTLEQRAHHAGLALLMPRSDLELYRNALDTGGGDTLQPELIRQLSVYFELDPEQILWRLMTLGWVDAAGLAAVLEQDAGLGAPQSTLRRRDDATLLPERFVRLVARAFGSGSLDLETAAHFLGTDFAGAERILSQFDYDAPATRGAKQATGAGRPKSKRGPNGNGGDSAHAQP